MLGNTNVRIGYTEYGIVLIAECEKDNHTTVIEMTEEFVVNEFMPSLIRALNDHAIHQDLSDAVNEAFNDL